MFGFPKTTKTPGFRYKRNLLKTVIFQVKFSQSDAVLNKADYVTEVLTPTFPNRKEVFRGEAVFSVGAKTPVLQSAKSAAQGFEFRSNDGQKVVALTSDALTYTVFGTSYSSFEEAISEIEKLFFPILEKLEILTFNRVAIRKINVVDVELKDGPTASVLPVVFSNPAVEHLMFFPKQETVESGLTTVTLRQEPYQFNIHYGLLPRQAKAAGRQLVLDLDLFSNLEKVELKSLRSEWSSINDEIFDAFCWLTRDQMRAALNQ